ncbi:RDD family protein [Phycicoccus sp. Soil802]|uniref:RDD family protein n=1 Tax=Phycicoccus sp. Soil802 TaxID=1736414 RepID=UPI0009E91A8D|nr:RDD family protein [Phycicoccus sp. Soil802]
MTQQPPHDPFAHPPAPGAAAPGQPAPGQPAPGQPAPAGYAASPPVPHEPWGPREPWGPLAGWGTRVLASLVDGALQLIGGIPYVVGLLLFVVGVPKPGLHSTGAQLEIAPTDTGNTGLMVVGGVLVVLGFLMSLGIQIWNRSIKQGRTGQSIGKKVMGIRLIDEHTGQPIGAGMAFVRELAHALDGAVYIGYLWPLWDDKRQTFADKILNTVVVEVPRA